MTIRAKILLLIAAVALIIGSLGLLSFYDRIQEAEHIARHEAMSVAKTLAFELTTSSWGRPEGSHEINHYVQEVRQHLNRDIVVVDTDQKIIGDVVESEIGLKFTHDSNDEVGMTLKDGNPRVFTEVSDAYPQGIKLMVLPLNSPEGRRTGALILEYTPVYNEILSQTRASAKRFLAFYIIAICLSLLAGYALTSDFLRSLLNVRDIAGKIASGDFDARIQYDRSDEIGDLSLSFNKMADAIRSSRQEMIKTNADLRRSEEKFRTLFDAATDGIFVLDLKGNFIDVNERGHTRLGYTKEEMLSLHISRLDPPEFAALVPERLGRIMEEGSALFESAHVRKDGSVMPVEVNSRILEYEGGKVFFSVIRDITERKRMENALIEYQENLEELVVRRTEEAMSAAHLASLGELAAGVAHEINNPINGIINYAQILANRLVNDAKAKDISGRIISEGIRIANIVKTLLSFGREIRDEKKCVHIGEVFHGALDLMMTQIQKDGIHLKIHIPDDLPDVMINPQQLQQVFLNVLSNARYALNQKYAGTCGDKNIEIEGERTNVGGRPHIRISLTDQGTGIPSDLLDKTIRPFFTTKPSGQGTGLGLSLSNNIIKEHGGRITLESREGEFTRVIIDVPAVEKGEQQA